MRIESFFQTTSGQVETLAQDLLNELPELVTGFRHGGIHFNMNVYPGKIASIYSELRELDCVRPIHARLRLLGEIASLEAYLEPVIAT